ncbi:hypothetical protein HBA54_22025 [Pelagibius litoralis]|uniref:SCP2 domain-containing protein n=1 Tax=Pelagibius litoralis TaxID=374515 RepID=A0A967F1J4_9PROT|nr:SCP2 sterol-binding domain-containing protein [Pelagibius litoralis]NIA71282.1 hypothetical protein [Pelagibius litoralis]
MNAFKDGELPNLIKTLLRPAPRLPLAVLLTRAVRRIASRRGDLIERLGPTARVPVAIMPSDLPFSFRVNLDGASARVEVVTVEEAETAAARIRAPLLILLGLLDGTYDGDALFFSRDLVIEGDTEHVLALRNTLEQADLTPAEFAGLHGPAADLVNRATAELLSGARRLVHAPAPQKLPS